MEKEDKGSIVQSRFKNLFEFLKAYNDLRTPVVCDISQQIASIWLSSLPDHSSIKLNEYIAITKQKKEDDDTHQENDINQDKESTKEREVENQPEFFAQRMQFNTKAPYPQYAS